MALTGLTWSFQWYRTAAYGLFGVSTARPAMSAPQQQNKDEKKEKAEFDYGIWDNVVSELQALYPSYASISLTAGKAQISKPGNMRSSDTAAFDTQTGEITTVTAYSDVPRAQKMKGWFYAFHTGSWGGMTTKVLYFLAAFIGGILPLSGYYLWLKRNVYQRKKSLELSLKQNVYKILTNVSQIFL